MNANQKVLVKHYRCVPLKKVPFRVSKYDVNLRESPLRAVQAMHAILSRMVLFRCNDCKERFPTFHPAYVPPPRIASDMELLKHGRDGVAQCSIEVAQWDDVPPLVVQDGLATCCSGTCLRCERDMAAQLRLLGGDEERAIVSLRSEENHMDPCLRFPVDDLQELFDGATVVESMLVALEHMQVSYVTVQKTRLHAFRKNTISFPQDFAGFARRLGLGREYRPGDRVDSVRGAGEALGRPVRKAAEATAAESEACRVDAAGNLVFPPRVTAVRQ